MRMRIGRRSCAISSLVLLLSLTCRPECGSGQESRAAARPVDLSAKVVANCKAATVLVDLQSMGSGSAACVSTDGFFVTNHHVVASVGLGNKVKLVVNPSQKSERVLEARVIKLDDQNDLALLKADAARDLVTVTLGTDDQLFETMPLTAFGFPFGRMLDSANRYPAVSVNTGAITALRKRGAELSAIQFDASVNPGNSGGPVVDAKGDLIGIVVSGLPGARLNFAIPVSRVKSFLAGPALVLRKPRLTFAERTKPQPFVIDAYAYDRQALENLVVELLLSHSADEPRTLAAKRQGDQFIAEGPACAPSAIPLEHVLVVRKGRKRIQTQVPPGSFRFGSRTFSWLAIDSLVQDGDERILTLLDGSRFAGKPVGLPSVAIGSGRTTQLSTADRIEVRVEHAPSSEVSYELQARKGETVFTPIRGRLQIEDTPKEVTPTFDRLIERSQLDEPIVVEAVVRDGLQVGIIPSGLVLLPQKGPLAGMESERGHYVLVNGQPWYFEQAKPQQPFMNGDSMPVLPVFFGLRKYQVRLLWARPEDGGQHDAGRVTAAVQTISQVNLTSIALKNQRPQPTRVALAFSLEPANPIVPLLAPRAQPVLESHWPLNDADPTRAIDLGPGKHTGLTSIVQTVPGVRGNAVRLDQQAILCPGVFSIDRGSKFTVSAWMKTNPGYGTTVFSRMNNGDLRGFDSSLIGTLQVHLIASWPGNCIYTNTVERVDPLRWHHVAVTYDGSSLSRGLETHLDGALATLEVKADQLSESIRCDFPFMIGSREHRDYYNGLIDELRIHDRTLSPEEIFELYDLERSDLSPSTSSTLTQGLVGYWPFEGTPADRFQDKSGHGHHGQPEPDLGLPEIVESDGGQALRIRGPGTVECGPIANFDRQNPYSMGAWFKPSGGGAETLFGTLDQADRGFDLIVVDGHISCRLIAQWDGNAIDLRTRTTFPANVWHHAVVTYDGSSRSSGFKIYVDGAEAAFDVLHDSLTTSTKNGGSFRIGGRIGKDHFSGDLDNVFLYRRAISAQEALAWFKQKRGLSETISNDQRRGLVAYWNFEGKGSDAYRDRSGNRHHGEPDVDSGHSAIVPSGSGRAARFRGVGGIDCGQAGDFERTDPFSAGGWFCWEGGSSHSLISKIHHDGPNRGYDIEFDGERYKAQLVNNWDQGPDNALSIQCDTFRGTGWRHVMFTYDGRSRASGLKLYVNGDLQKVTVLKDSLTKSIRVTEPFVIGSRLTTDTIRGRAAHVRLIARELTAEEVSRLAKADRPPGSAP